MKIRYNLIAIVLVIFAVSCNDDNGSGPGTELPDRSTVYVINEGNFEDASGSLTSYNTKTKEATSKAFEKANGRPFAGYIQTSAIIGDRLYVVANKTNKIEVLELKTLKSLGTIELSKDPVSIAAAGKGEAYVTNLFDNSVTVLDLENMKETDKTIPVGPSPYFAFNYDGKVYVSNNGFGDGKTISVIDTQTNSVETTLTVGAGPKQITEDLNGYLWIVSQGKRAYDGNKRDPNNDIPGGIYIVDGNQQTVVDSVKTGGYPKGIALNGQSDKAYVLYSDKISILDMNTYKITDESFISRSFNTIGYSQNGRMIYLGQSKGLSQSGQAIRYNLEGSAIDSFTVGISPVEFRFVENN